MKKLYKEIKYKKFNKHKSLKVMRFLTHIKGKSTKKKHGNTFAHPNKLQIVAPTNFSLINNFSETQSFFQMVFKNMSKDAIFLNFSNVAQLTVETILYLVSIVSHNHKCRIYGNAPENEKSRKIFLDSGFYKYVNSNYSHKDVESFVSI